MTRARPGLACGCAAAAFFGAGAAYAQTAPQPANVLSRACSDETHRTLSRGDIARALVAEAGVRDSEIIRGIVPHGTGESQTFDETYDGVFIDGLRALLAEGDRATPPTYRQRARTAIAAGLTMLKQRLDRAPESVTVEHPPFDLLVQGTPSWRVICDPPEPVRRPEDESRLAPSIAIRETPEELWLSGPEGRKAGAFALGFERTRTSLDDGTRQTATSFTIDGTAGVRITTRPDFQAYLFATYNLQRDRTRPPPTLDPGASESDADTNALALGVDSRLGMRFAGIRWSANLQAATIFDFANDASRVRFRAILTPRPVRRILGCQFGAFSRGQLQNRCEIGFEVQAARVLRRGTTELGDYDSFLAAGVRGTIEFFLPTGAGESADTGFLASARYRFLPVIHGAPDDIERLELKLAHRFWTSLNAGIDVGFTYTRGTNELSFEDENVLTFGLGVVY